MSNSWEPLSRRTVLRGLGATIALPFLEAMLPRAARAAEAAKPPLRTGFIFMPNGVRQNFWAPKGEGENFELSPILAPLKDFKKELLVLTNLCNSLSKDGDGHYAKTANWLTGMGVTKTTGKDLDVGGVSIDQMIAEKLGHLTRLPSLELGTDPVTTGVDANVNYTRLYGSHISWRTRHDPLPCEINPRTAFDRLFRNGAGDSKRLADQKSVLDLVREDTSRLRAKLGRADQAKVEEYLDSIRSVEKRIEADIARCAKGENLDPSFAESLKQANTHIDQIMGKPGALEPGGMLRLDHTEHVRSMFELIALAFWSDNTRTASFMFGHAVSTKNFSFLDGVNMSHHETSHHENNADKMAQYQKINEWHSTQFAWLLERLKSIKEGDGTLLDHSLIMYGSSLHDGNSHDPNNLPLVLAGRANGTLNTGRHVVHESDTPLCNLYLSMLRRQGIDCARFGDSTGELKSLA